MTLPTTETDLSWVTYTSTEPSEPCDGLYPEVTCPRQALWRYGCPTCDVSVNVCDPCKEETDKLLQAHRKSLLSIFGSPPCAGCGSTRYWRARKL